jgi:hypothetical protein
VGTIGVQDKETPLLRPFASSREAVYQSDELPCYSQVYGKLGLLLLRQRFLLHV